MTTENKDPFDFEFLAKGAFEMMGGVKQDTKDGMSDAQVPAAYLAYCATTMAALGIIAVAGVGNELRKLNETLVGFRANIAGPHDTKATYAVRLLSYNTEA